MRAVVKKWGNSAAVRMPVSVMEDANLSINQAIDVRAENGRVVIEAIEDPALDLDELLAAITPENVHGEVDFGRPVGKEAL